MPDSSRGVRCAWGASGTASSSGEFRGPQLPLSRSSFPLQDRFSGRQHVIGARLPQPLLIDVARRSLLCGLQVRRCYCQAYEWLFRPAFPGLDHGVHIGHGVTEISHLRFLGVCSQGLGQVDI